MGDQTEFEAVPNLVLIEGYSVSETCFFLSWQSHWDVASSCPHSGAFRQLHPFPAILTQVVFRFVLSLGDFFSYSLSDRLGEFEVCVFCLFLSCRNPKFNCLSDNYMDEKRPG